MNTVRYQGEKYSEKSMHFPKLQDLLNFTITEDYVKVRRLRNLLCFSLWTTVSVLIILTATCCLACSGEGACRTILHTDS